MDLVSIKWNNHNCSLVNSLDHFKSLNNFADVTLVCEGHTVKAHKVILSSGSNLLHRLLVANPAQHPVLILTETKYDILRIIIDFLYKGKIDVPRNELNNLIKVATTLEMNELKDLCKENLSYEKIDSETASHNGLKAPNSERSSPKNKRLRRLSSDCDVYFDTFVPKREISDSPCSVEHSDTYALTETLHSSADIEPVELLPQIDSAKSLSQVPESCFESNLTGICIQNTRKKDASTECDIQPLQELKFNSTPKQPPTVMPRLIIRPSCDTDDSYKRSRKRSLIWKYYTAVDSTHALCRICHHKLSYKTTVTNLTKHLRNRHSRFDPKRPPNLPEVPVITVPPGQLEVFEEIDFNFEEEEDEEDEANQEEPIKYEEASNEDIPSTSTPCIMKII